MADNPCGDRNRLGGRPKTVHPPQCSAFRALELDILVVELGLGPGDYIRLFTLNLGRLAALHIAQIIQRRVLAAARLVIFQGRVLAALASRRRIAVLEHLLGLGSGGIHFLAGAASLSS